ncbi:hypothetical protein H696_02403 [Fonticula alba]|uniref:Tyrosine specific protein phosphatases domain-containing protein n=1 Tax=Fonticula alba TaxID=691883 RepID=A0A058ZDE8_FONAL|nr:hypothetical protein H696_02403 [Fonticula alba]KCV71457.1 hypothetical protein H696_02403 [Fonticula alba]|eukprot:XP_009494580.1 hypothetical protein H696_02403 [Fonticula alba]
MASSLLGRLKAIEVDRDLLVFKILYTFVAATFASLGPFLSVIFAGRGLTPSEIGIILCARPFVFFAGAPLFSIIADRARRTRWLLLTVFVLSAVIRTLIAFIPAERFALLAFVVLTCEFFGSPVYFLIDTVVLKVLGKNSDRYGQQRLFGSIGPIFIDEIVREGHPRTRVGNLYVANRNAIVHFGTLEHLTPESLYRRLASPPDLPPNWVGCPNVNPVSFTNVQTGKTVNFLALKAPLDSNYDSRLRKEDYWTPQMLFAEAEKNNWGTIGLVIDLTKSSRYYDERIVTDLAARYVKIICQGRGATPTPDQVSQFVSAVDSFLVHNPEKIIAVHCTHGCNRTGFMLAAYARMRCGLSVDAAINIFAKSRCPGIYKHDYLRDLLARYQGNEDMITFPEMPTWHLGDGPDAFDPYQDGGGKPASAPHMIGPRGDIGTLVADPVLLSTLQNFSLEMCRASESQTKRRRFPGAMPVSLTIDRLSHFDRVECLVSWKADGGRFFMVIWENDLVYMADRHFNFYEVAGMKMAPLPGQPPLTRTLLDGEIVVDSIPGSTPDFRNRFLVYDIMALRGKSVVDMPYKARLKMAEGEITGGRNAYRAQNPSFDWNSEPFSLRMKLFLPIEQVGRILKIIQSLPHENDGLMFAAAEQIVECVYAKGQTWRLLRGRPDKSEPNQMTTARNVFRSIQENLDEPRLLASIEASVRRVREKGFPREKPHDFFTNAHPGRGPGGGPPGFGHFPPGPGGPGGPQHLHPMHGMPPHFGPGGHYLPPHGAPPGHHYPPPVGAMSPHFHHSGGPGPMMNRKRPGISWPGGVHPYASPAAAAAGSVAAPVPGPAPPAAVQSSGPSSVAGSAATPAPVASSTADSLASAATSALATGTDPHSSPFSDDFTDISDTSFSSSFNPTSDSPPSPRPEEAEGHPAKRFKS